MEVLPHGFDVHEMRGRITKVGRFRGTNGIAVRGFQIEGWKPRGGLPFVLPSGGDEEGRCNHLVIVRGMIRPRGSRDLISVLRLPPMTLKGGSCESNPLVVVVVVGVMRFSSSCTFASPEGGMLVRGSAGKGC